MVCDTCKKEIIENIKTSNSSFKILAIPLCDPCWKAEINALEKTLRDPKG